MSDITSVLHTASIYPRCFTNNHAKHLSKVTLVAESRLLADRIQRFVRASQQHLGLRNTEVIQIGMKRLSSRFLEEGHEMRIAHCAKTRRIRYLDGLIAALF